VEGRLEAWGSTDCLRWARQHPSGLRLGWATLVGQCRVWGGWGGVESESDLPASLPAHLPTSPPAALAPPLPCLQVRALAAYLRERQQQGAQLLEYETAVVTAVQPVGMGDRACVDLCR